MMLQELSRRGRIEIPNTAIKTQKNNVNKAVARPPSPLRLAIILLIQHPQLAQLISEPLPSLELNGYDLFSQLVMQAKEKSPMTTAILLERWRGTKEEKTLAKLAQWELMLPENCIEKEFLGTLSHFQKISHEQKIEGLLAKAAAGALSSDEKKHLSELIQIR